MSTVVQHPTIPPIVTPHVTSTTAKPVVVVTTTTGGTSLLVKSTGTTSVVKPPTIVTTTSSSSSVKSTTTSSKPTTTTPTTSSTTSTHPLTTSSTIIHTTSTSSTTLSSSTSSSSTSSSTVGLSDANAGSKNSSNHLSTGIIVAIVGGSIVFLLLIGVLSTRAIRKKRRNTKRRASSLHAWSVGRTGNGRDDDDFFGSAGGAGVGGVGGVGRGGQVGQVGEKSWGMEMTPSREKLDDYSTFPNSDSDNTRDFISPYPPSQPSRSFQPPSLIQSPYQTSPNLNHDQWIQHPQPIAQPINGLVGVSENHGYSQISRSQYSHGDLGNETYAQDVPTIVTHLPEQQQQQQQQQLLLLGDGSQRVQNSGYLEHDSKLKDDMWVVVKTSFAQSLEDELVIQPNDRLYLVQAYDDGWCLCQNLAHQRGFVPLYCLQPATTQNNNTSSSSQPTLALHPPSPTMQDGGPTSPISPALMSPGVVGEGQKETLRFLQPVMVVNGQNQQGSGGSMSVQSPSGNALPRSDTSNSLGAKSERSQRRSSLYADANTASAYVTHQSAAGS